MSVSLLFTIHLIDFPPLSRKNQQRRNSCWQINLSIYLPIDLSIYLSISLSIYLSIYLIYLPFDTFCISRKICKKIFSKHLSLSFYFSICCFVCVPEDFIKYNWEKYLPSHPSIYIFIFVPFHTHVLILFKKNHERRHVFL